MMSQIFELIDTKIEKIEEQAKKPVAIVINTDLFKQLQKEFADAQLAQKSGFIKSPYSLQNYKGCTVISSAVIETLEVY